MDLVDIAMLEDSERTLCEWTVQLIRLTVFLSEALPQEAAERLWLTSTGSLPDSDENRPREGIRRQAGVFGSAQLEVVAAPGRVDWLMGPLVPADRAPSPYFANLRDGIKEFTSNAHKWLDVGADTHTRVAVGATFLLPAPDVLSSYEKLRSMLKHVTVDPLHSADFLYQINWPVASEAQPGLKLNRLTKWMSLGLRAVSFDPAARLITPTAGTSENFCRLECDHSTDQENRYPLQIASVHKIFDELCTLMVQNVEKGEVSGTVNVR